VVFGAETSIGVSIDPNGNLTGDGTKTYEWDANNKLIAVKQGGSTLASFTYDSGGRRATKAAGGAKAHAAMEEAEGGLAPAGRPRERGLTGEPPFFHLLSAYNKPHSLLPY
jgi:YD repeat-containing protein